MAWISKDFSIIADSGDNPTAGGVGDRAEHTERGIKAKDQIRHYLLESLQN